MNPHPPSLNPNTPYCKMEIYIIYGITDCPACLMAQAVLMEARIEYAFVEMDFSRTYRESVKEEFGIMYPTER